MNVAGVNSRPGVAARRPISGVYERDSDGDGDGDSRPPVFHPASPPTQEEVEAVVCRTAKRVLGFLQKRGVIAAVSAPGDGEVTIVGDDTLGESDPLLARLLGAAAAGAPPAGPAHGRAPVRLVMDPGSGPQAKGRLCAQQWGFNLHAASRVAANDKQGREILCRYVLRPPLANDRLHVLSDDKVQLDFKRPWSNGTKSVVMAPLVLIRAPGGNRAAAETPRDAVLRGPVITQRPAQPGGAAARRGSHASRAGGNRRSRDANQSTSRGVNCYAGFSRSTSSADAATAICV